MLHKKVEFTELFYDLVFVYAISKTTGLIHHLHHGLLPWNQFFAFLGILILLINTWMLQTVYTNRYGHNSKWELLSTISQMAILLFLSNTASIDLTHWQAIYKPFGIAIVLLTALVLGQYLLRYRECHRDKDKQVVLPFLKILGFRFAFTFMGLFLPYHMSLPAYLIGFFGSLIMPVFFRRQMAAFPIHFAHLVERISLLVIIILGEMLIGIADHFTLEKIGLTSLVQLGIVVSLFLYYFLETDQLIDKTNAHTTGMSLIYLHYPIFIGLLMTAVSLAFMSDPAAHHRFVIAFLYTGLTFFYASTLALSRYNLPHYRLSGKWLMRPAMILGVSALLASLVVHHQQLHWLILFTTLILFLDFQAFHDKTPHP